MTQLCYVNQDNDKTKEDIVTELMKYMRTDSIMFRTPYTTG